MRARWATGVAALSVLAAACVFDPVTISFPEKRESACEVAQRAEASRWDFGEWFDAHTDDATRAASDAGTLLEVSFRAYGANVRVELHPPVVSGDLPRGVRSTTGCALHDSVFIRNDADGKLYTGFAHLELLDGGQADSTAISMNLTRMSFFANGLDGGVTTIPDKLITLPIR